MLVSLSGIIKFVDQLKKSGQGSYDALGAGLYTILSVPRTSRSSSPMAALLGALLGLGMLAQRSELVVMQASGFTRLQVALAVMKTAIPLVLLTMAIGEWVAPQGEQMARNYVPSRCTAARCSQPSRGCGRKMATILSISNA
ncbi:Permease [Klebsiella pneumoniae]|uniref:Permease n=1 Tax=Klebsiella pneumoniae TaxID=573 RepID=A0A377WG41_KLEPN|nr:Permease [Klebsiella pneumoniae]